MLLKEEQLPDVKIITAERSEIITGSPYKEILEEKKANKRLTESLNQGNNLLVERDVNKKKVSRKNVKKGKSLLSGRDVSKKTKKTKNENLPPPRTPDEEKTVCPLCAESNEEDWIQCGNCKNWVHEACANISELSNQYICDFCIV